MPVLSQSLYYRDALLGATLIVAIFWLTTGVFEMIYRLFPPRLIHAALMLWLAFWGYALWVLVFVNPLWIACVFLMNPVEIKLEKIRKKRFRVRTEPRTFTSILYQGIGFWLMMAYLAFFGHVLGNILGITLFVNPGGAFLLLMLLAFLWRHQPGQKVSQDPLAEIS